ncbi:hypothetical protein [Sodalis ligni]|uniref:hypothetical protein n=1 Tax=Sodalis ligni TaxID=2697027 RepID=UPI00104F1693|nr:hypothetical protein [Sodalis ligni]
MHGYSYIPHPLYNLFQSPQIEPYRSKEFVYFGHINRYKGLVELLTVWPAGIKIEIHGKCSDPKLLAEIIDIISSRKLQVTTDFSFISEEQLKELLIQTKYIVLPHAADSMIVSGAFYHSISYGANILIKKSKFGNEVASRHNFCTTFDYDNLASVLTEQKYIPANNVLNEAINNYGFDVFKRSWLTLL